jgi:excisionase family DNA binding protein
MAKMFYTIEETAEKLKVTPDQVREMATAGKLQQFRDRDKLMFKREQVDGMTGAIIDENDESSIPLASSGDTDAINLADEKSPPRKEDPRQATGVSVFDTNEVEHADPMAQTQVTAPVADQEQLALESVGSGSGLLDLTRESDDTSLGAELLDEIYPGGNEGTATKGASVPGSSGVFDGAIAMESGASGLENLQPSEAGPVSMVNMTPAEEAYDPAGSGMSAGALMVATVALIVGLFVAFSAVSDVPSKITGTLAAPGSNVMIYALIMIVAAVVFAAVGFFIGRAQR